MNFHFRCFLIAILVISLTSCSWIPKPAFMRYRDKNYLRATSIPPLRIPPGTSSAAMENYYPIPEHYYSGPLVVDITPPGLND